MMQLKLVMFLIRKMGDCNFLQGKPCTRQGIVNGFSSARRIGNTEEGQAEPPGTDTGKRRGKTES